MWNRSTLRVRGGCGGGYPVSVVMATQDATLSWRNPLRHSSIITITHCSISSSKLTFDVSHIIMATTGATYAHVRLLRATSSVRSADRYSTSTDNPRGAMTTANSARFSFKPKNSTLNYLLLADVSNISAPAANYLGHRALGTGYVYLVARSSLCKLQPAASMGRAGAARARALSPALLMTS